MELTMLSKSAGLGLILNGGTDQEMTCFKPMPIEIGNQILKVGEKTTMFGKFEVPLRYVGFVENQCGIILAFHLGSSAEGSENKEYYSCYVYENKHRLLNLSSEGVYVKYVLQDNGWTELYN